VYDKKFSGYMYFAVVAPIAVLNQVVFVLGIVAMTRYETEVEETLSAYPTGILFICICTALVWMWTILVVLSLSLYIFTTKSRMSLYLSTVHPEDAESVTVESSTTESHAAAEV
jgi:hypothetical protein